jgi:multidrug efflux pump subunit AcrA (membrane-fusion protein)
MERRSKRAEAAVVAAAAGALLLAGCAGKTAGGNNGHDATLRMTVTAKNGVTVYEKPAEQAGGGNPEVAGTIAAGKEVVADCVFLGETPGSNRVHLTAPLEGYVRPVGLSNDFDQIGRKLPDC